jgi:hypothetical protein
MARDIIAAQIIGSDLTLADVVFTPIVAANDLEFTGCNKDSILMVQNSGTSGAQSATVVSVADEYGRTGDKTTTTAQDEEGIYGRFLPNNWHSNLSTFSIYVDSADEDNHGFAMVNPSNRL